MEAIRMFTVPAMDLLVKPFGFARADDRDGIPCWSRVEPDGHEYRLYHDMMTWVEKYDESHELDDETQFPTHAALLNWLAMLGARPVAAPGPTPEQVVQAARAVAGVKYAVDAAAADLAALGPRAARALEELRAQVVILGTLAAQLRGQP